MAKRKTRACNCIEKVNAAFEEAGEVTRADTSFTFDGKEYFNVATYVPGTSRKKPRRLLAIYCPICGKKYA